MSSMVREQQAKSARPGILYLVATPIGNPGDITLRAIEVLREADLIACEDTRRAGLMLAAHQIRKPLLSYFEHNEERRVPELIARLRAGEDVALVTDAGTPCISDPGFKLVRAAYQAGLRVTAVPGPCAVVAGLCVAGIPTDRFTFEGFLPARAAGRKRALEDLRNEERTMVFFEAGRRLWLTLSEMVGLFGADREAAVVREITKVHEETTRAALGELAERFARGEVLGEVAIIVEGASRESRAPERGESAETMLKAMMEAGVGLKQASAVVAKLKSLSRREVYNQVLKSHRE